MNNIVFFIDKGDIQAVEEDKDFIVKQVAKCSMDDNYLVVKVSPSIQNFDSKLLEYKSYVMAFHQEKSKYIVVFDEILEDLSKIFGWGGGAHFLVGEMLTDAEKMNLLSNEIYDKIKKKVDFTLLRYEDTNNIIKKLDDISVLFGETKVSNIIYQGEKYWTYWPSYSKYNYNIAIIDDYDYDYDDREYDVWEDYYEEVYGMDYYDRRYY